MSLKDKLTKEPFQLNNEYELFVGTTVELEHTDSIEEAKKIALDHLKEDKQYYSKLYNAGLIDEKDALKLINKYKNENNR